MMSSRKEKRQQRTLARGYLQSRGAESRMIQREDAAARALAAAAEDSRAAVLVRREAERLSREAERLSRDAHARSRRSARAEAWAHEHVHGEEGEILPPEAACDAMRARMEDMGASTQQASRAAVQMRAQQLARSDPSPGARYAVDALPQGTVVWYQGGRQEQQAIMPARVVSVEAVGEGKFSYAVQLDGPTGLEDGPVRHTVRERLVPM